VHAVRDIAPYLSLALAVVVAALAVLLVLLWVSVRRLRRGQLVVMGRHEERDVVAAVESLDSQVHNLRDAVEILTGQLDEHKRHLDHALTNRALLRYDAFRDTGGEQSASLALLDNYRSGLVISAITARDFARIYVKHLDNGAPDRELSPEEQAAVEAAVPTPLPPEPGAKPPTVRPPEPPPAPEAAGEAAPASPPLSTDLGDDLDF
jgi:hypothetical protein